MKLQGFRKRAEPYGMAALKLLLVAGIGTVAVAAVFNPWILLVYVGLWLVLNLAVGAAIFRQSRYFNKEVKQMTREWSHK